MCVCDICIHTYMYLRILKKNPSPFSPSYSEVGSITRPLNLENGLSSPPACCPLSIVFVFYEDAL